MKNGQVEEKMYSTAQTTYMSILKMIKMLSLQSQNLTKLSSFHWVLLTIQCQESWKKCVWPWNIKYKRMNLYHEVSISNHRLKIWVLKQKESLILHIDSRQAIRYDYKCRTHCILREDQYYHWVILTNCIYLRILVKYLNMSLLFVYWKSFLVYIFTYLREKNIYL